MSERLDSRCGVPARPVRRFQREGTDGAIPAAHVRGEACVQPVAVTGAPLAIHRAAPTDAERVRDVERSAIGEFHPAVDQSALAKTRRPVPRRALSLGHGTRCRSHDGRRCCSHREKYTCLHCHDPFTCRRPLSAWRSELRPRWMETLRADPDGWNPRLGEVGQSNPVRVTPHGCSRGWPGTARRPPGAPIATLHLRAAEWPRMRLARVRQAGRAREPKLVAARRRAAGRPPDLSERAGFRLPSERTRAHRRARPRHAQQARRAEWLSPQKARPRFACRPPSHLSHSPSHQSSSSLM